MVGAEKILNNNGEMWRVGGQESRSFNQAKIYRWIIAQIENRDQVAYRHAPRKAEDGLYGPKRKGRGEGGGL